MTVPARNHRIPAAASERGVSGGPGPVSVANPIGSELLIMAKAMIAAGSDVEEVSEAILGLGGVDGMPEDAIRELFGVLIESRGSGFASEPGEWAGNTWAWAINATGLKHLTEGLGFPKVWTKPLDLSGCDLLESIPDGLDVGNLDLQGCASLRKIPSGIHAHGWVSIKGCESITEIPGDIDAFGELLVNGCSSLVHIGDGAKARSVDILGCPKWDMDLPDGIGALTTDLLSDPCIQSVGRDRWVDIVDTVRMLRHCSSGASLDTVAMRNIIADHLGSADAANPNDVRKARTGCLNAIHIAFTRGETPWDELHAAYAMLIWGNVIGMGLRELTLEARLVVGDDGSRKRCPSWITLALASLSCAMPLMADPGTGELSSSSLLAVGVSADADGNATIFDANSGPGSPVWFPTSAFPKDLIIDGDSCQRLVGLPDDLVVGGNLVLMNAGHLKVPESAHVAGRIIRG
jgi:hypothetical protein